VWDGIPKHQGFVVGKIDAAGNIGTHGVFVDNDACCPPPPPGPTPAPTPSPPAPPPGEEPDWVPKCK
jgi:hypothetical protein